MKYTQQYKLGKLLIVYIFMLNINYTQQYKLGKLLIVYIFILNINYTQQYKLNKFLIVFIFMLSVNYTRESYLLLMHWWRLIWSTFICLLYFPMNMCSHVYILFTYYLIGWYFIVIC